MHHQQLKRDNYVLIKYDGGGKPHGVLQSNNLCALIGIPTLIDKGHTHMRVRHSEQQNLVIKYPSS